VQKLFKEVFTAPGQSLGSRDEHLPFGSLLNYEYLKHRARHLHIGRGVAAETREIASLVSPGSDFMESDEKRFADSPSFIGGMAKRHKISRWSNDTENSE